MQGQGQDWRIKVALSAWWSQDDQMWTTTGSNLSTSALPTVLLVSEENVQPDWARGKRFTLTQQHNGTRQRLNVNRHRGWGLQVLHLAPPQALVWLIVHRTGNKTSASGFLAFTVNRQWGGGKCWCLPRVTPDCPGRWGHRALRSWAGCPVGRAPPSLGSSQHAPHRTKLLPFRISALHLLMAFTLDLRGAGGFSSSLSCALRCGISFKRCENLLPQNISRKSEGPARCGEGPY